MNERDPRFWNTHDDALSDDDAPTTGIEKGPHMSFADWLRVQQQAHLAFGDRLALVTDWSAPTPDEDWDVSALVRHVIEEQQWVPLLLAGRTVGEARSRLEPLGDDLVAEWERYSADATAAWASVDPHARVNLSYDTVPASAYLREQASDVIVHTWDLARAVGADENLGETLVAAAWTVFEPQKDALEASGLFASPVPIDEDASLQSRLLALTGRDDRIAA
ncbi:TIGR03086 family metal-binding protein [Humibacter sp.]|uniref:TIGR03086 family metal-binding protein n=1 Tax=Humibacter sp. TaxID=1940291 RepID=UPI003F8177DE